MRWAKIYSIFVLLITAFCLAQFSATPLSAKDLYRNQQLKPRVPSVKPDVVHLSDKSRFQSVIVKFDDAYRVRFENNRLSAVSPEIDAANAHLAPYLNGRLRRLFHNIATGEINKFQGHLQNKTGRELADLNNYYQIDISSVSEAERLLNQLNALDLVELAYAQPIPEEAIDKDPPTANYTASQTYRLEAPRGVDAVYASTMSGGDGTGVKLVDIEYAWQTSHEDLEKSVDAMIGGDMPVGYYTDHGTAVIGELIGTDNNYGVTGICPGAEIGMISISRYSAAEAIVVAALNLEPGDFILIELHAPGPRYDYAFREDQAGYICLEYWSDVFDAIEFATAAGMIVVEAAGNGAEDLDDIIYGNRFDTTYRNSHAIMVGAGGPWSWPEDRQRLDFSNYGRRVDLQGDGRGVYTTGYGDLFAPDDDIDQFYTAAFAGTSSATPIVAGAAACLQGHYRASYNRVLDADQIRTILTQSGTPQRGDKAEHIGPRPDLYAAFQMLPAPSEVSVTPSFINEEFLDNTISTRTLTLINHSPKTAINFDVEPDDGSAYDDWLRVSPSNGTIPALDSAVIEVAIDATVIEARPEPYEGSLDISWGVGDLDSTRTVTVYVQLLCNDVTYQAVSSTEFGAPEHEWVSAHTLGTKIDVYDYYASDNELDRFDDGSAGPFPLGFDFEFYGKSYNEYYVGINGAISFTDRNVNVGGYYSSRYLIPGMPFVTLVAPFWNDLYLATDSSNTDAGIYRYTSPTADTTVVEWFHLSNLNDLDDRTADFAAMFLSDGTIVFMYDNVGVGGLDEDALIGLDELDCKALGYYAHGNPPEHRPASGQSLRFATNYGQRMTGDANNNGSVSVADVTYLITWLFGRPSGPAPSNMWLADANCSGGNINILDVTYLVSYLFGVPGGPAPCQMWMVE